MAYLEKCGTAYPDPVDEMIISSSSTAPNLVKVVEEAERIDAYSK
jgi:hypothetical protein